VTTDILEPEAIARFSDEARQAVYDVIALRRDVRHFDPGGQVDEATLLRILGAAHAAPSVGLSQPWGFVVIRSVGTRERVRESFLRCRAAEAARFPAERREKYLSYRLEGILEAPLNVCVAVDLRTRGEAILGTTVQPESLRASACCAVQNLWLAARAEGLGVGWVSIVEPAVLRSELALPPGVEPIAYVCVGHPRAFRTTPMLEEVGWSARRPLANVTHEERWRDRDPPAAPAALPREAHPALAQSGIPPVSAAARDAAIAHQAVLTKPKESLGRLEELAIWYAAARGTFPIEPPVCPALALFLADHGVVSEGVSAYGSQITAAMACNVMAGGAAVSVLARKSEIALIAVDVGIAGDLSAAPREPHVPLLRMKVRAGTANFRVAVAMSLSEARSAMDVGARIADDVRARGSTLAGVGEIGIGNTTAGAALVAVFAGVDPEVACGRGTGIDDEALARKIRVVRDALALHRPTPADPIGALAAIGGLELAAMTGFILRAAAHRIPIVLDGFLSGASALVARAMDRNVVPYLLASHASAERGARLALASLGLEPVLALGMRLGEGTGALLGIELVRSAVELQSRMATFATAGIIR
jgi:nicotinate-nucleotide--dimethylbenzimidazole phosphoribosyltransferase